MITVNRHPQRLRLLVFAYLAFAVSTLHATPVLMISIDGLKPEYVTHAAEHGLHIPTLQRFLEEGAYAEGVIPVLPSVTYPDHTTLITGVWPASTGFLTTPSSILNVNLAELGTGTLATFMWQHSGMSRTKRVFGPQV